jgi:hypothetical protein
LYLEQWFHCIFLQVKLVFRAVVSLHFVQALNTSISWVLKMHWKYMGNKTQRKIVFSTINIFAVKVKFWDFDLKKNQGYSSPQNVGYRWVAICRTKHYRDLNCFWSLLTIANLILWPFKVASFYTLCYFWTQLRST